MSDEIFDLVDEQDQVIGQQSRREVHRLGLRHRAVHILVLSSKGELFLQKRSLLKDKHPGVWDSSSSGHLDSGEDYDACAVRELREELACAPVHPPVRLFKLDACPETGQEFVWVYKAFADGPFSLHPEEISEGNWFTLERITAWISERPQDFAPAFVYLWPRALSFLRN
ncbi:MAG: NUDIX domain-containing protein [Verrucomicrobiota bacterium]|nr:NUDIX domain-containing protein [Verrucomicrobiota bacterium]